MRLKLHFIILVTSGMFSVPYYFSVAQSVQYFVAVDGNDAVSGTLKSPFATLEQARDAVRQIKEKQGHLYDSVIVWLREGVYTIDQSFVLDSRDAGLPGAPVVYRAYPGDKVILRGGTTLPSSAFKPVADRSILGRMMKQIFRYPDVAIG
jgi:hypothetical protein